MPTIRIDHEVYAWLQGLGVAFEDTPNSVLRRIAKLDEIREQDQEVEKMQKQLEKSRSPVRSGYTGRELNEKWKVGARHALFSDWGTFYNNLVRFPGALFDLNGYVKFDTKEEYLKCSGVKVTERTNVYEGISSLQRYVKVKA